MSTPRPAPDMEPCTEIDAEQAREMALFLVRVFGEEAGEVAAERVAKSPQREDWRRIGGELEKLLGDDGARRDPRPLRLFE